MFNHKPHKNGLFPACTSSTNPDMQYYWIRDNYFIWKSGYYQKEIENAFRKIVIKHKPKIVALTEKGKIEHDWEFIHPRYDENLNEIPCEWGWKQLDTLYYLSKVLAGTKEGHLIDSVIMYLDTSGMGAGIWEDGDNSLNAYDLMLLTGQTQFALYEKTNLSHLIGLLEIGEDDSDIIERVIKELEGEWGVVRYKGDRWTGENFNADKEYEWCMGFAYLYKLTGEDRYIRKLDEIYERFGGIPESINPLTGEASCNTPLIWADALYWSIKND